MALSSIPEGTVPRNGVLWVETQHPKSHQLDVTWRIGGPDGEVVDTGNRRNLDLEPMNLAPGTVVHVEVRDPVGPDGIDWVRNPSADNTSTNSGYNGPRFVQNRQWTVGDTTVAPSAPAAEFTLSSMTSQPVGGDEVVFVESNHPTDRVLDVAWRLNGALIPNPNNSRNLDLEALNLAPGTYSLTATATDPADPGGVSDTIEWTVDNVLPTAHRSLSEPLTTLADDLEHPVYFGGWDMFLDPQDDPTGYDEERFVVGQLRLDRDGWFNYFGFPEQENAPFKFRHSGTNVKALTYGNLGTGGLSRATFEQTLPDDHPSGGFIPGFGTHFVEHRAIDPAGNYGDAESYRATVLPGESPECTTTASGPRSQPLIVESGVTCLEDATVNAPVFVRSGASLVASDSVINGSLVATGAEALQLFGTRVNGTTLLRDTTRDVTIAGSAFNGALSLTDNTQVSANERFSRLAGEYGPISVAGGIRRIVGRPQPAARLGLQWRGRHTGSEPGLHPRTRARPLRPRTNVYQHTDLVDPVRRVAELIELEVSGGPVLRCRARGQSDHWLGRCPTGVAGDRGDLLGVRIRIVKGNPQRAGDLVVVDHPLVGHQYAVAAAQLWKIAKRSPGAGPVPGHDEVPDLSRTDATLGPDRRG
jgi:hypothetical protein